ncbi:hypothetical protein [Parasitella parasitica]|uniref:Uncharacterized protein n=1 Tax=Parasitella parasitica TaxID=35722 RepID=A0A0B7NU31_9FUNG|nr:hypothetical protein [Parasitella parasitica]
MERYIVCKQSNCYHIAGILDKSLFWKNNSDEYSSSESYEKDFDIGPNRDNTHFLYEIEDELADMEVDKNLQVYDGHLSNDEIIDDSQTFKNPTMVGASEMRFNGFQNMKVNGAPGHLNLNYMRTISPQRLAPLKVVQLNEKMKFIENALQGVCKNLTHRDKSHYNVKEITVRYQKRRLDVPMEKIPKFIESCNYQTLAYQMKLNDTRKNVATFANVEDFIEKFEALFDYNGYEINRHWYAQVQDSVFMAIMCFSSLKEYVKTYLKAQLPTMRMAQRGSVTPPINSDTILPYENWQSLMELLEAHSSAVHRDLLDLYQKEASVDPTASTDVSSKPPATRFDRKGHDAVLPSKGLCTHCGKVEFYPGHFCPERIAFQNARQNAVNNSNHNNNKSRAPQTANKNRTGTFAVRPKYFTKHATNPDHNKRLKSELLDSKKSDMKGVCQIL